MASREDGRLQPRFAVEIDVEVQVGDELVPARTRDVSRGGLCFLASRPLPIGHEVAVGVSLVFDERTFSEPLRLRARVVWCTAFSADKHQIGTAFTGLTQEQRSYLDLFLRYLKEGV